MTEPRKPLKSVEELALMHAYPVSQYKGVRVVSIENVRKLLTARANEVLEEAARRVEAGKGISNSDFQPGTVPVPDILIRDAAKDEDIKIIRTLRDESGV